MSDKFDLAKAQAGEPIMTRDGKRAKFVAYIPELSEYKQTIIIVETKKDKWLQFNYHVDGMVGLTPDSKDLIMAPKPRIMYVNVHNEGFHSRWYGNMETARLDIAVKELKCTSVCKITVINGEITGTETVYRYEQDNQ